MNERHFKETLRTAMFTALAVVVCACSQDEVANDGNTLPSGKYPLQIARATVGEAQTRVSETTDGTGSQWDGGEQISVRIGTKGSVGKYTLNANGTVKSIDTPPAIGGTQRSRPLRRGIHQVKMRQLLTCPTSRVG